MEQNRNGTAKMFQWGLMSTLTLLERTARLYTYLVIMSASGLVTGIFEIHLLVVQRYNDLVLDLLPSPAALSG